MKKNINKINQSGRSMVEMLGVLAIIGVLSITGISGYTTAMNKHKANQILDAASKRAVAVSTQIQRGNTNPTLGEFDDNTVGDATFDDEVTVTGNRFQISFETGKQPSEEVWAQMQSITGSDGIVREFKETRIGLVYNNDLTTDAVARDYKTQEECKTPYTWCAALKTCQNVGESCSCPANSSTTSTTEGPITGTSCYCNSGYKLEDNECKSNLPYCAIEGNCVIYSHDEHGRYATYQNSLQFCEQQEKSLVTLADIGCSEVNPTPMGTSCSSVFNISELDFWLGDILDDSTKGYFVYQGQLVLWEKDNNREQIVCK